MKKLFVVLLAFVLFSVVVACSKKDSAGAEAESVAKKVVNVALSENLLVLDPHNQSNIVGQVVCDMCFDALVRSDHGGNYTPALATEWVTSTDGLTWSFKLRQGVKFHDGEAFNADDVVTTFQRLIDNRGSLMIASTSWPLLESVTKTGEYSVDIKMKEPYGAMLLGLESTYIIPNEAFARHGEKLFTDQIETGTGAWVFKEWVDGQFVRYEKNKDYWEGNNSQYDEVYLRFIMEPSTAIAGQLAGDIDAYIPSGGIVSDLISLYDGHGDIELIRFDSGSQMYMGFQCGPNSVFSDPNVRKAFSAAIDRQAIIDNILGGGALTSGPIPQGAQGFDPTTPVYEYDAVAARSLLASSSYNGQPIKLSSNVATKKAEEQLLAVSGMINSIGFNSTIEVVESATLMDMRTTGKYDVFLVFVVHQGGDPYTFLNFRILNDAHHSNYRNETLNQMIRASNAELDQAKRSKLLSEVNAVVRNEYAPMIMLARTELIYAINKGITGIDYYGDGYYFFRRIGQ
jgi:ABC-type transport system substrate-binding protein